MKKGQLIVISGFAGTGKGTLVKLLTSRYEKDYILSVSATTRQPRAGEREGIEYFFKTVDEFEEMIRNDELLEYAKFVDNYYGTPASFVKEWREAGRNVILEIEIQGALKIKEKYEDTVLIFVVPPSAEELKARLIKRGTETEEVIDRRLKRAGEESEGIEKYDYVLVNDDLEECVEELHQVICASAHSTKTQGELIERLRQELKVFG
ncbi:MAG: guanylate kinase [Lachnospiraceae bacterium]|nr:guanylate kinase [Lachnospiraceae bacterium]